MKKRSIVKATAIAALCLLAWPLAVQAARRSMTEWEALVRIKLAAAALLLSIVDAHLTYDPYIGTLDDNTYRDIRVTLHKGVSYVLLGVCDDDCRNLNMKLYDEDGQFVGADTGPGSTADLEIQPRHTQDFILRMIMKRCNREPCYYGLGVYND